MPLLAIGFAVGLVVAFLLRALIQYERDGLSRVSATVSDLAGEMDGFRERIEALEAIVTSEPIAHDDRPSEAPSEPIPREQRQRA